MALLSKAQKNWLAEIIAFFFKPCLILKDEKKFRDLESSCEGLVTVLKGT